jgi:hypothetical protein
VLSLAGAAEARDGRCRIGRQGAISLPPAEAAPDLHSIPPKPTLMVTTGSTERVSLSKSGAEHERERRERSVWGPVEQGLRPRKRPTRLHGMADIWEDAEATGEPLEWQPQPVKLLRYDTVDGDDCALRIFFDLVGDSPPGTSLSDVWTSEAYDRVAVTVIRRDLVGTSPDGAEHGHKLNNCLSCLQIPLRWPFGNEHVIDGSTGMAVTRLDRAPAFDPEQGDLDHHLGDLVRINGCPLWR